MTLSSGQLEAFVAAARSGSISGAAKALHVTQSAVSQRILNLEAALETAVFIRDPAGLRMTALGEDLMRLCQAREAMETEFLQRLGQGNRGLAGTLRIAGFSSIVRSAVMPALTGLLKNQSAARIHLQSRELRELPQLLIRGETDMILSSLPFDRQDIETIPLGEEHYVLAECDSDKGAAEAYLDHDQEDTTTDAFLRLNGRGQQPVSRIFLDEIYAIIDGVRLGWGKAVLPRHMIRNVKGIRQVKGMKPLRVPVALHRFRQPFYPGLHVAAVTALRTQVPRLLG